MHARRRLEALEREKAAKEAALARGVAEAKEKADRQKSALNVKIEKMRKLQELALGSGVGDEAGDCGAPVRKPSPRGRQLLYWEALKSKNKETSSMSWRGQDVFAHEQGI